MKENYFTKVLVEEYVDFLSTKENTNSNKEDILHFIIHILTKYHKTLEWNSLTEFMKHVDNRRPLDYTNPEEMTTRAKNNIRKKRYRRKDI